MKLDIIAISISDYKKYGCPKCGCLFAHSTMSGGGAAPVTCGECNHYFVLLDDSLKECPISFGNEHIRPLLVVHPRKGYWPHEFVRPDIRPLGIDGEFWAPRGVGYDLSGFVMSKAAGERIIQMIRQVMMVDPNEKIESWLDYREKEPLWIQVKISAEDGFNLKVLCERCRDGVITTDRLIASLNSVVKKEGSRQELFQIS